MAAGGCLDCLEDWPCRWNVLFCLWISLLITWVANQLMWGRALGELEPADHIWMISHVRCSWLMSIVFRGSCCFRHKIRESASASDVRCRSESAHWFDRLIDHLPALPVGGQGACHMDIQHEADGVIGLVAESSIFSVMPYHYLAAFHRKVLPPLDTRVADLDFAWYESSGHLRVS